MYYSILIIVFLPQKPIFFYVNISKTIFLTSFYLKSVYSFSHELKSTGLLLPRPYNLQSPQAATQLCLCFICVTRHLVTYNLYRLRRPKCISINHKPTQLTYFSTRIPYDWLMLFQMPKYSHLHVLILWQTGIQLPPTHFFPAIFFPLNKSPASFLQ